jgi:integrase
LLKEYEEKFAADHYRKTYSARNALSYYFQSLNSQGITDAYNVAPSVISEFLASERKRGKQATSYLSFVKVMYDWFIVEGRRTTANPVVSVIHRVRRAKRKPRPYSDDEMDFLWKLLEERGNARLRLAFAMGEETGLRASELCNVRIEDVDFRKQVLNVRLPNKTMTEGTVRFHRKTRALLPLWLAERDPNCGHDFLFHNTFGRPWCQATLQNEFQHVVCKVARGSRGRKKVFHEVGVERFNFHRLRHRMASQLARGGGGLKAIMAQGRWASSSAACGYIDVPEDECAIAWADAVERAEIKRQKPRLRTSQFHDPAEGLNVATQTSITQ